MPRLIEFQGRRIELPDNATDDHVAQILAMPSAAEASGVPTPPGVTRFDVTPNAPPDLTTDATKAVPARNDSFGQSLKIGAQGVGSGMASLVGAPVDLATGAINLGIGATNMALGPREQQSMDPMVAGSSGPYIRPITQPFGGSESIKSAASSVASAFGAPPVAKDDMTPGQKLGYHIADLGTQFALPAAGMAAGAGGAASAVAPTFVGRTLDTLRQPYQAAPARTALGDAAGGVGAGAGVNAVEDNIAPDSPWKPLADIGAVLGGGVGGATAVGALEGIGKMLQSMWMNRRADVNVPKSEVTGRPFNEAETERAARAMQGAASNPATAAQNIRENSQALTNPSLPGEVPLSQGELPTSGLLSRDPGLVTAETGARTRGGAPFVERDQSVKAAAADRVGGLRDPDADPSVVTKFMEEKPKQLAADRDAEALPLLQQAESSGAQVNAQGVADLIDSKLAAAKRPPVRAALTEARKLLNKPGTDELDASVAGLYETRKAINDVIAGRGENSTGQFAKSELIEVRKALDAEIEKVSPEFGEYLKKYREGSEPINAYTDTPAAQSLASPKNNDIRNTAAEILNGRQYGAEQKAAEIDKLVSADPAAKKEWRNALIEVLTDKVTSTRQIGETHEVQAARLAKEFKDNEAILAAHLEPEEMNTLRQAHTLLGYFKEAEKRALTGSQTAERMAIPGWLQLATRHLYGDLKGGGIIKRFKLLMEVLPSNKSSAEEVMNMAWFDPGVAAYLLERPVRDHGASPRNVPLARWEALLAGSRESTAPEQK